MKSLCRFITLGCLLFLSSITCFASGKVGADVLPFDRYGRISWEEEDKRLEAFAVQLKKQPHMIGYIYVREAQISCAGYALSHAIGVTKYLIQNYEVPWNRVSWKDLGYGDGFEVSLWLFPAGQPPLYVPEYQPESNYTFIEDCLMMARTQRAKKRLRSRGAANKGLQRTRR
jgi:hypothetical protein